MTAISFFKNDARSAQGSARFQRAVFGILPNVCFGRGREAFRQDAEMSELEARAPRSTSETRER